MDRIPRTVLTLLIAALAVIARGAEAEPTWLRIATPEFTIITSLDRKEAIARGNEFAQYIAALRSYFSDTAAALPPLTIVVFADDADFSQYRPQKNGKPERVGGYFVRHESWSVIGQPAHTTDEARRTIFHEAVHWFTSASETPNPAWLEEGMAEVFSTFRVEPGKAVWAELIPDHVERVAHEKLLPLERLLFTPRSEVFDDIRHTNMFYAESWAFVHMLMFGKTKVARSALSAYSKKLASGMNPDSAFIDAFGRTYQEMDRQFLRYVGDGQFYVTRRRLAQVPAVRAELASPMDVDDALARLSIAARLYPEAIEHARAMTARIPTDPRGHALLGIALLERGKEGEALKELELAARYGTTEFQPYFELGRALQKAAVENGGAMSAADARRAADYYERAFDLYPKFEGTYTNLAGVIGFVESVNERDDAVLAAGANRFPGNPMITLGRAQIARRSGDREVARRLLDQVLTRTADCGSAVARFAVDIRDGWEAEEIFRSANDLIAVQNYDEALALIDRREAAISDASIRGQIIALRRHVEGGRATRKINEALQAERWDDARHIIEGVIASDLPDTTKNAVKRALAELDRRTSNRANCVR